MGEVTPLLRLTSLHFHYVPERQVLRGASLSLHPGERLAIRGPNGCGKSTLFRLVLGLLRPISGAVEVLGRTCRAERDFVPARREVGLLFQDPDDQLFCPTVVEDVAFGPLNLGLTPAEAAGRAHSALASVGLAGFEERITHHLSGGEKRLVSLASVLAMEPQALLLDEPATGLDEEHRERLLEVLAAMPRAMILVSHDRDFRLALATRHLAMRDGVLAEEAP